MVYALFAACQQELTVKDLCFLMTFVLATNNEKKLAELRAILSSLDIEIISLSQAGVFTAPEETGNTFEENALIKARAAMSATGLPAIADDSGLEVDALGGAPGVFSARYGSPQARTDEDRNKKLLHELQNVPAGGRGGRFICAAACVYPDGTEFVERGQCEGELLFKEQGAGGFGYDPLFFVPEYGLTMAQMTSLQKNSLSHRAKALIKLRGRIIAKQSGH